MRLVDRLIWDIAAAEAAGYSRRDLLLIGAPDAVTTLREDPASRSLWISGQPSWAPDVELISGTFANVAVVAVLLGDLPRGCLALVTLPDSPDGACVFLSMVGT